MCRGQGLMGLGITLVILGSLSAILGIAAIASFWYDTTAKIGAPIWTGFFVILTGVMGIMGGKNYVEGQSNGFVAAFLTLSIIGIFVCIAQQSINGVGGAAMAICGFGRSYDGCIVAASIHWTCIALGFIEMVMCFASSIVGCVVGCGCCAPSAPQVVVMQPQHAGMTVMSVQQSSGMQGGYAYPQPGYVAQPPGYVVPSQQQQQSTVVF